MAGLLEKTTFVTPAPKAFNGPGGFVDNAWTRRLHRRPAPSLTSFTRVSHRFDVRPPPFHDLQLGIPDPAVSPRSLATPRPLLQSDLQVNQGLLGGKTVERDLGEERLIVGPTTTGCWSGSRWRNGRCTGRIASPTFAGRIGRSVPSSAGLAKRSPSGRLSSRECSLTGSRRAFRAASRESERPAPEPGRRRRAAPGPDSGPARRGCARGGRADWRG